MQHYMTMPPKLQPAPPFTPYLPVGTRIKFIKELSSGPDDFSPGNLYAEKGGLGAVTGHGCAEGHWVKWDKWKAPFGSEYLTEFVEYKE